MGLPSSIDPLHTTKLGPRFDAPPKSSVQSQGVFNDEMGQVVRQRTHESITGDTNANAMPLDHGRVAMCINTDDNDFHVECFPGRMGAIGFADTSGSDKRSSRCAAVV
jgi:hypothetical protein